MSSTMPPYENRYVCYLDILGFKNLVGRMDSDEGLAEAIHSRLTAAGMTGPITSATRSSTGSAVQFTAFSDSIVFSNPLPLTVLLLAGTSIVHYAGHGVFLRGAITKGRLFHEDQVVYGPALVRAAELEKTAAKVPRVLIDDPVVDDLMSGGYPGVETSIGQDADSRYFVKPFDGLAVALADPWRDVDWFREVQVYIEKELEAAHEAEDAGLIAKYTWLAEQLNAVVESSIPNPNPTRFV